ncbi:MAG: hypothetical protein ABIG32_01825 [Candidatus Uhrbacteria bacterium]|nr:hypothetical protein [Patescibacteria group bacterium]
MGSKWSSFLNGGAMDEYKQRYPRDTGLPGSKRMIPPPDLKVGMGHPIYSILLAIYNWRDGIGEAANAELVRTRIRAMGDVEAFHLRLDELAVQNPGIRNFRLSDNEIILFELDQPAS